MDFLKKGSLMNKFFLFCMMLIKMSNVQASEQNKVAPQSPAKVQLNAPTAHQASQSSLPGHLSRQESRTAQEPCCMRCLAQYIRCLIACKCMVVPQSPQSGSNPV